MEEKSKELLEKMRRKRGYVYPAYRLLATEDPGFLEDYDKLYSTVMLRERVLPQKIKELFFVVAIAARNPGDTLALKNHIRRAISMGAKKEEILEALECVLFPGGALSLLYSVEMLEEALWTPSSTR